MSVWGTATLIPEARHQANSSVWRRGTRNPSRSNAGAAPMSACTTAVVSPTAWPRWPRSPPTGWPGAPPSTCERRRSRRRRMPGTMSSSDGQRIPVAGKIRHVTALPRYFRHQGVTFYSWTSGQLSQYGTKVIPATLRDATYVLDAILDNETELTILEHATDTAGYTELVFALFDLLGMQFAPRLRDLGDQQLYRLSREQKARHLAPRIKGTIRQDLILRHWDDLLRLAGSLKRGWVTASLFISKLQAYPRQNVLTRALQEYGRLLKTIFILRYLENADYRRRINVQLNKGESLHALRDFLFVGDKGVIRRKQYEAQTNQAMCLNVVTNAVIIWNTVYMQAALDQLRSEGYPVHEEDVTHLSPARFEHINPFGKYSFPIEQARRRVGLRTLRAA